VVGWPVAHSLSPKLHGHWLKEFGIEGAYNAYEVAPDDLPSFIRKLAAQEGMRGCNLTIPHKEAVMPLLGSIDAVATRIGAVNTIIIENGQLHGTNTDAYGFAENIRTHLTGTEKAVVLGAGGAARAVCVALEMLGFAQVVITNRTHARAQALAAEFGSVFSVCQWEEKDRALERADLLVNTTSLGLKGQEPLEIDLSLLPRTSLVTDIVYKPLLTPLLEMARGRGHPVVDGLGMLIHQAVPGFEAWFGQRPKVDAKRLETLKAYLLS
jgi:shikimate dehydrogenase